MNKQEISIVVILFALLLGWGYFKRPEPQSPIAPTADAAQSADAVNTTPGEAPAMSHAPAVSLPALSAAPEEALAESVTVETAVERLPEIRISLSNERCSVAVSSFGGSIVSAELSNYRQTLEEDSGPVSLDFAAKPALSLVDLPGLSVANDFDVSLSADGTSIRTERVTGEGLHLDRTIAAMDGYLLEVRDVFSNRASVALQIPAHGISSGPMSMIKSQAKVRGLSYLGLDTLSEAGGARVFHWAKGKIFRKTPLAQLFEEQQSVAGEMPANVSSKAGAPMEWAAVKNKFFVQILAPEGGSDDCAIHAERDASVKGVVVSSVAVAPLFEERTLEPGESWTRVTSYYVGPKKLSRLSSLGRHQEDVMQFGKLKWICTPLLWLLNRIYAVLRNYGLAIIVLTAIVRVIFWPVTHKSTESMKKMQKIQPLVKEVREKYKGNSQKMNQEVMALYKEHKVNPTAGCLPIIVQIPVFIALFTVLRSAVELRFAGFLWIADLSEPEGLLAGVLPIPLNILPLFMSATMAWQQHLTPSGGDSQQQKMMLMMPVVMLFIFYNMASALVLYWSVSQSLSIVQLLHQRRKGKAAEAVQA